MHTVRLPDCALVVPGDCARVLRGTAPEREPLVTEEAEKCRSQQDKCLGDKRMECHCLNEEGKCGSVHCDGNEVDTRESGEVSNKVSANLEHESSVEHEGQRDADRVGDPEAEEVPQRHVVEDPDRQRRESSKPDKSIRGPYDEKAHALVSQEFCQSSVHSSFIGGRWPESVGHPC